MSLSVKFAVFTSLLSLALITAVTYLSYRMSKSQLERSIGERLEAIVRSGALGIDGTLHDTIRSMADVDGEPFLSIRDQLRALQLANQLETDVYTMRRVGEQLEFVVMTNEKPFVGDTYSIKEAMLPTLNHGQSAYTGVYQDEHGRWISAYAPILDQNGHHSGLLEADIDVQTFLTLLQVRFRDLLIKSSAIAVLAIFLSVFLARSVTRKLVYLTDVTEKISLGKLQTPIRIKGNDEVAKLGHSLERMRESLKIAAEMIQ